MESDLVKFATERITVLQNERNALQQRRTQLNTLIIDVDTRMVEIQGAIRELEIVMGRRDINGQLIQAAPIQATNTEKKQ
jgi:hypothetical protein